MEYSIALTFFILVPGQVNKKFLLVLNEKWDPVRQVGHGVSTTMNLSIFILKDRACRLLILLINTRFSVNKTAPF